MEEQIKQREYPNEQTKGLIEPLYIKIEELESKQNKLVEILSKGLRLKELNEL